MTEIIAPSAPVQQTPSTDENPGLDKFFEALEANKKKYPPLAKHRFRINFGEGPGFSEFYPAHERDNPNPGEHTVEVRQLGRKLQDPENRRQAMAGEMLHLLGTTDEAGRPYDPSWYRMKQEFIKSFDEKQLEEDRGLHKQRRDPRSFEQAFEHSESDAYIRSYLFPNVADPDYVKALRPEQKKLLDKMKSYLESGTE